MDNINQEAFLISWMDIKHFISDRFVPSYYRRERLFWSSKGFNKGPYVDEYATLMESLLLKVRLQFESEEEKVVRFVSDIRREIKNVVELYEYSTLDKILHLA